MLISVITCTWNSMATLRETVASVQAQGYSDIEHVFVDGGSSDGTLEYIHALECRKRVLRDVGGGISRAMNEGVAAATGEVICHLHSDDYFLHGRVLQRVAKALAEQPQAQWLFGRIVNDIDGALVAEKFVAPRFSRWALRKGNFIPHPAVFIRRAAFVAIGGFSESLKFAMDYDLLIRLSEQHVPVQLDEALTVFRRHAGSTTQKHRMASFEEDFRVRMSYTPSPSAEAVMHRMRYLVRRRRLLASL